MQNNGIKPITGILIFIFVLIFQLIWLLVVGIAKIFGSKKSLWSPMIWYHRIFFETSFQRARRIAQEDKREEQKQFEEDLF